MAVFPIPTIDKGSPRARARGATSHVDTAH